MNKNNENNISVLFLSDLHFDELEKPNEKIGKINYKKSYHKYVALKAELISLAEKIDFDFIVVGGDIKDKTAMRGFENFNKLITELKVSFNLTDNILVVPGNHDVNGEKNRNDEDGLEDFYEYFCKEEQNYIVPLKESPEELESVNKEFIKKQIKESHSLIGGIQRYKTEKVHLPFLLDRDKKVLFYLFNSSSIAQSEIIGQREIKDKVKEHLSNGNISGEIANKDIADLVESFSEEISIDPSKITITELSYFQKIIMTLRENLSEGEYESLLKIAVLHHQITNIFCIEEEKKFDYPINVGEFKKALVENGFNVVIHGHKHYPEIFTDSAISGGGSLLVVSGGTICGESCEGRNNGFYLLNFSTDEKTMKSKYYTLDSQRIKNERIFDYPINQNKKIIGLHETSFNLDEVYKKISKKLADNIADSEENGKSLGWNKSVNLDKIVGIVATSYGLVIEELIKCNNHEYLNQKNEIINSLWKFRIIKNNGKGGFGKFYNYENKIADIEGTVWATRAFFSVGDTKKWKKALEDLYKMINNKEKFTMLELTLTVDLVCELVTKVNLEENLKNQSKENLSKFIERLKEQKEDKIWENANPLVAVVYTAIASQSLINYYSIIGENFEDYLKGVGDWLLDNDWEDVQDCNSRYLFYTAPLVIKILLKLNVSPSHPKIIKKIEEFVKKIDKPNTTIWEIYQIVSCLKEFVYYHTVKLS